MSLLDVRRAKEALAWRLKEWGCDGDPAALAGSFIDDLVQTGWRMDAMREDRPQPPKVGDACRRCGRAATSCDCRREPLAADYEPDHPHARPDSPADATLARALLAQSRAGLCGCGVRVETCPTHRPTEETADA